MSKYSEMADALRDCAAGGLAKALNEGGAYDLTFLDKAAAALRELEAELGEMMLDQAWQIEKRGDLMLENKALRAERDRLREAMTG